MLVEFDRLPDRSRLWIFAADRELSETEEQALIDSVDRFLTDWTAHGTPLAAGRSWRHSRFLLVAVDEGESGDGRFSASGCSIDALVHTLQEMERRLGVGFLDRSKVWYRSDDSIAAASRTFFRSMVASGEVDLDGVVFDNSVTRLSQVREGEWERALRGSWHEQVFSPTKSEGRV